MENDDGTKIVELGPLFLAGQPFYGSPEGNAFGQAWERFNAMHKQVPGRVEPKLYEVAYPFDFELYDDDRFHDDANSEIDVYIPIKEK
jgi:hypothetical protein